MKKFAFFAALLGILALGGCGRAPHEAGVLRLAQESDPTTLDPARAYDTTSIAATRSLYSGLIDYDYNANFINVLASERGVSKDGKSYWFRLRPGLKWHDGTPIEAADFKWALERVLDPATASDGRTFYEIIEGAKEWSAECEAAAKDKRPRKLAGVRGITVEGDRITYKILKPDATFLNNLALPFAYAVPRRYVQKLIADTNATDGGSFALSENPNGSGPFRFQNWVHDGWLSMVKNRDYFRKDQPRVERIEMKIGISSSLQIMLFEQGAIDILGISDAFPADFLRLTQNPKYKGLILDAPMMDVRYLCINNEVAPFNDKRVRQALNYAINRDRIVEFLTGRAVKARGALPPGMPGYNSILFQYAYNPAKARELLKAANFRDGAPIPLLYATNEPWYGKAAQSIQQDLRAVGVSVSLVPMRYGDLKAKAGVRGPNGSRLALMGWLQDYPDPANFLDVLFNGKSITPKASINRAFYSNPKVNALLDAAIVEQNRPKRLQMYQSAEKIIVDEAPWVFLHHTQRYVIRQPWVKNFRLHPMWSATYEDVAVD